MMNALEHSGLDAVYLRNYEKLPEDIGNDVDLLVGKGTRMRAISILKQEALNCGWVFLKQTYFSPIAVYFANLENAEILHIDLFDRMEWHFVEYADSSGILSRKRHNGTVYIPAPEDEIYLNLITRLAYQGVIRDKHRIAVTEFVATHGETEISNAFERHLGAEGVFLYRRLKQQDWLPGLKDRRALLAVIGRMYGVERPQQLFSGVKRYILRFIRKMIHPPGIFIAIEGADGVGKSTILEKLIPWSEKICAGRNAYHFHWKPNKLGKNKANISTPVDPRGRRDRSFILSLAYLGYHFIGFWCGWLMRIYPLLIRSHAVVGDRYSYDLYLDPSRFRLGLPKPICRAVALLIPRPTVTVALVADPNLIHARKPELTVEDIVRYQDRWKSISEGRHHMATVSAESGPDEVLLSVKLAILKSISLNGTR